MPGFRPLPQTTPKLYWKNLKLFKLLDKNAREETGIINITQTHFLRFIYNLIEKINSPSFFEGHSAPEISTIPEFVSFRLPPQVRWNLDVERCGTSTFNSGIFLWNLGEHFKSGTSIFKCGTKPPSADKLSRSTLLNPHSRKRRRRTGVLRLRRRWLWRHHIGTVRRKAEESLAWQPLEHLEQRPDTQLFVFAAEVALGHMVFESKTPQIM